MDASKLKPILNKESTLKTALAMELAQAPQDVLTRYQTYALTHVPLGETSDQLANLRRVITKNKTCAIGTIVGPYGYGKTSTAVHLWNELRHHDILTIPPFEWTNLQHLVDAVYYWARFEFSQGPAVYVKPLDAIYEKYASAGLERVGAELDPEIAREWFEQGRLNLDLQPLEVLTFYSEVTDLAHQAGYEGMGVFTDELQATVAAYKPSRDQFFDDLFHLVKDTLGRTGNWAWVISMDDDTEGTISRLRADLLQRMQRSALYFRVEEVYDRRQYPAELWEAFAERFDFEGSEVILRETLESIGQIASRRDLGAGPRMVTNALSLAVSHYDQSQTPYTPLHFVDDFISGLVRFGQRGKFPAAVKRALENAEVAASTPFQKVVKLLAAYPAGCSEETLARFDLLDSFRSFPPLARREMIVRRAEGHTLRYLLEEDRPPEQIEQRLTQEFVARYAPGPKYARMAAEGFLDHVLLQEVFSSGWKTGSRVDRQRDDVRYQLQTLTGTFDDRYPERKVTLALAVMAQSPAPNWTKLDPDADIELRFEFNYSLLATEPTQLLVAPDRPEVAVLQFNLNAADEEEAQRILPDILFDFYSVDQVTPQLTLALVHYMFANSGDLPDDIQRVRAVAAPLRQFALTLLLGEEIRVNRDEFASGMVGYERIKDLFRVQCQLLYPRYQTLMTGRGWQQALQQYNYALESVINEEGVAVARGRRPWESTKEEVADAFRIPNLSLTRLETALDRVGELMIQEEYSGRRADSPVRLRFQLHPLENQWLAELEMSDETGFYDGMPAPAISAITLIRQAENQGYTLEEVQEVMNLLQSRQYVTLDDQNHMLIRRVDNIAEIKEQVVGDLERLAQTIDELEAAVPEFERRRYPLGELRDRLDAVGIREEAELLRRDIHRYESGVNSFATSRATDRRERYRQEITDLRRTVQAGVPSWLDEPFAESPLQDLLEQQRRNYAEAYQATLRDVRDLSLEASKTLQNLPESPLDALILLQKVLPELSRASKRLKTRLRGYNDLREDMSAWRSLITQMSTFTTQAKLITDKYGSDQWERAISELWQTARNKIEGNPVAAMTFHREISSRLIELREQAEAWLKTQREDYEQLRQRYEEALARVSVGERLLIPFNAERPAESYGALAETVQGHLARRLDGLMRQLKSTLQKIHYATLVQDADLADVEAQAVTLVDDVQQLRERLSAELLRDGDRVENEILQPVRKVSDQAKVVAEEMQRAMQKREPDDDEAEVLELLRETIVNGDADLYSVIMRQLDRSDEAIELEQLMNRLMSLFQKNQIGIRVKLL